MNPPVVLISIFRETIIGGVAVHSSNLYERLLEESIPVSKVNYAPVFVAKGVARKAVQLGRLGIKLLKLRLSGARLFHFHASNRALVFYLFAPVLTLLGGRCLLSVHSGYGFDRWLAENPLYDRINGMYFRLLHALVFMNPAESRRIARRYGFLSERIVTINPFIAPPSEALPVRSPPTSAGRPFRIAAIGVWMGRYNVEEAIRAAVRFNKETGYPTEFTLMLSTVIIEPEYRQKLERIITEARKTIHLDLLENRTDILDQLAGSDVLIRSSKLDSYGLCVAESLLVGTPVIATDLCRRCNNAMLYRQGDTEALHQHLLAVFSGRDRPRRSLLEQSEDSFYQYRQLYAQIA